MPYAGRNALDMHLFLRSILKH